MAGVGETACPEKRVKLWQLRTDAPHGLRNPTRRETNELRTRNVDADSCGPEARGGRV